jgi:hypothetical protein
MPLINSAGNLLRAVNTKADSLIGLGAGILCLPSIIAGSADIFKGIFLSLKNAALKTLSSLVGGIGDVVSRIVEDSINKVIGGLSDSLSKIVKAVATVRAIINAIKDFRKNLIDKINNAWKFALDSERCKYAAAALAGCIVSQTLSNLQLDKKLAINLSQGLSPLDKFTDKLAVKAAAPGGIIQGYLDKSATEVDTATTKINAISLF